MRLLVRHATRYDYDAPQSWGLLQLRLRPKPHRHQRVIRWDLALEGARPEASFEDQHRNAVDLVSLEPGATRLSLVATGEVEVEDTAGVLGPHGGYCPLWLFERATPRTEAGEGCRALVEAVRGEERPLLRLHDLKHLVGERVRWTEGATDAGTTAEEALGAGRGVCQDQAQVFIACARLMGTPARYVAGYLLRDGAPEGEAAHAWAEAWLPDLGWVGFDPANGISPDARYVRVATGLDAAEAAPVSGARRGPPGGERLSVTVAVEEAQ